MRNLKVPENKLFAYLFNEFKVETDKQLARKLNASSPTISRIRNDYKTLTAKMILTIYDKTDLSIEEIRKMASESEKHGKILSGRKIRHR